MRSHHVIFFDRNTTGQQVEQNTLIGNILRIGTCGGLQSLGSIGGSIESAVARQYFSNVDIVRGLMSNNLR